MRCIWLVLCIVVCIMISGCKSISPQVLNQSVESTPSPLDTVFPSPSSSPEASPTASATQVIMTPEVGEDDVVVGDIKLVSDGMQYAPLTNWIYSCNKDGLCADGMRKRPQDVADELDVVSISDDAQIVIDGKPTDTGSYSLYDEQYQEIYYRRDEFVIPEESGRYILCMEKSWGTEKVYEGYQYFFLIEKPNAKSSDIQIDYGSSNKFSKKEIMSAVDRVLKKFKDFEGCTLTKIWYDEPSSNKLIDGYMAGGKGSINGVKKENVIVLLSNFTVDETGGDGSLNPNYTYADWNWILIRDIKTDSWVIDDWGY